MGCTVTLKSFYAGRILQFSMRRACWRDSQGWVPERCWWDLLTRLHPRPGCTMMVQLGLGPGCDNCHTWWAGFSVTLERGESPPQSSTGQLKFSCVYVPEWNTLWCTVTTSVWLGVKESDLSLYESAALQCLASVFATIARYRIKKAGLNLNDTL